MSSFRLSPWRFLDGLTDRIIAVCGGILFGQFPQFYGQYLQRLGGHTNELHHQILQYTRAASIHHLTIHEYIRVHLQSGNPVFISSGKVITNLVKRLEVLEKAYQTLKEAPTIFRGWVFIRFIDPKIAWETWTDYTPGVPVTWEGLTYALFGIICSWGLYYLIKKLLKSVFMKRGSSPAAPFPPHAN